MTHPPPHAAAPPGEGADGQPSTVALATAARILGIGAAEARELAGRGEFPCPVLTAGGEYRVLFSELLRALP